LPRGMGECREPQNRANTNTGCQSRTPIMHVSHLDL
jgi:hypothetical protein